MDRWLDPAPCGPSVIVQSSLTSAQQLSHRGDPPPHFSTHEYTATGVAMVIINTNHQRIVITMATVGAAKVVGWDKEGGPFKDTSHRGELELQQEMGTMKRRRRKVHLHDPVCHWDEVPRFTSCQTGSVFLKTNM